MTTLTPPMNPEVARLRRLSAQRKLARRMSYVRKLWFTAGILLLVLAGEVLVALSCSPRFWIYRIKVSGVETLTEGEVIRLAKVPRESNYYSTSLTRIAERIRTGDPRVARVTVQRGTVGTLQLAVHERQAVCRLAGTNPPWYLDARGYLFTRPVPPAVEVPMVQGLQLPKTHAALGKPLPAGQVNHLLTCLRELHNMSVMDEPVLEVERVIIGATGRQTLVLRQGARILLGRPEHFAEKLWTAQKSLAKLTKDGHTLDELEYIDVRVADSEHLSADYHLKPLSENGNTPQEGAQP